MNMNTPASHWTDELVELGACQEAIEWARTQPSLAQAWRRCKRGDWMAWLVVGLLPRRVYQEAHYEYLTTLAGHAVWEVKTARVFRRHWPTIKALREAAR